MRIVLPLLAAGSVLASAPARAQDDSAELAKKLSNPVAALISVPFQLNYDRKLGPQDDGGKWTLNVQPVVPIEINKDWNVISRTIVPLVPQEDVFPGTGRQSGLGDVVQSFFFSPKVPKAGGWIWGAGPTAVMLKQQSGWTVGALANHIWSFAGDSGRADVSATFVQPFLSYTTPTAWTFALNTESTYDWKASQWSVPVKALVTKVAKVGGQLISVGGGLRYWVDSPEGGPQGLGYSAVLTLLFPK